MLDVRVTLQVQNTVALGANPSDAQRMYASDLLMTPEDEETTTSNGRKSEERTLSPDVQLEVETPEGTGLIPATTPQTQPETKLGNNVYATGQPYLTTRMAGSG